MKTLKLKLISDGNLNEVESFVPCNLSGKRGLVNMSPLPNQESYDTKIFVECNKTLSNEHPIGTRFRIEPFIL
jgi:hypothetical protein